MWRLGDDGAEPEWRVTETPFDVPLFGVVQTVEGPYAVGAGGHLVADRGDGWEVVFDDGPSTRDNQLRAVDATDDGERVWMLGSSGAMACYDVEERKKFDYSYPNEMTSTWEGIAVSGDRGAEKALAANGSGAVLPFTIDGFDVDWGQLAKPAGKGSKMAALAATPDGVGFGVDTSGNAFKTTATEGWVDIGIVNAQVKFYDIYAGANQEVYVAAGDGRLYRYDDSYNNWTPIGVTDGTSLQALDVYRDEDGTREMVALGADGSIFQRTGTERWEEVPSPTRSGLTDLTLGDPDVGVGKSGVVIERPRGSRPTAGSSADGDQFDGRGENFDDDATGSGDDPEATTTDDGIGSWNDVSGGTAAAATAAAASSTADDEDAGSATADGRSSVEVSNDAETADSGSEETDAGVGADAGAEADADTESDAGADADTDAESWTDPETKENVLVAIAERTDLEAVDVAEAAEQGSEIVEAVLMEIAEDVGIDPERVREALNETV
ncbi:hypothetical protein JCM30237_28250 [Halolamina litorea]|uniref:Uncharacterized protein n=1 Tax=Halolamina litorea TaxID=1515593 RepID=A0ABD6BTN5_9EURY|nr:hypothetical protein [Halolamina litorea]